MCYTPEMSAAFAIIGAVMTYYMYKRRDKMKFVWIIFLFYTLMEVLQTLQFRTLNKCSSAENQLLTQVALVFVIVQPLLWNYYFYTTKANNQFRRGVFTLGMVLSILWIVAYLMRYGGWEKGDGEDMMRGPLCTRKEGDEHFYWTFPMSKDHALTANFFMYLAIWFIPLFFSDDGASGAVWIVAGALLAYALATRTKKARMTFASTWCYISVPLLIIGFFYMINEKA